MNKVILMGRLTRDPEVRYSQDGKGVVRFDFAVPKRFKKEGEVDANFFSCVGFGKIAETFEKCNVVKGTKLIIEGEVQNNNYTKQDGTKVYGTQIAIDSFEFAESKASSDNTQEAPKPTPKDNEWMSIPDGITEELPFV